ncbi:peptide ABC transporter substrate-binding protein [Spectribacter hydrogenoxidans]|uniref:Peptide ABC transporter substrate-binding protein n=1 Tax=Spectribacter hydrogenoxidans TaxID=3075608 RepID=A0ABU3BW01_9GAMM|nr:peptide ABC transporter substrate-binding protein [Salinisphaera sp. W335]MDT0633460.1 peptide ABC transporter substrate-binding protein [Salinisphaera sp. W335]
MRVLLTALGVGLLLAGCGQGGSGESDSFPVKIKPEILDDGTGVLRKGNGAEPGTLDPHKAQGVPAANILRDIYEGLISEEPDGTIEPGGAESWEISEDRKTYTFKLREDAVWSNGEPVRAEDYAYGLRRTVDPATGSVYASILAPIENAEAIIAGDKAPDTLGVTAVDEFTLEIRLKAPTPYFLGLLTHSTTYPLYRPAVEEHGDQFTQPGNAVTNGAYLLKEWVVASEIVLEANPDYWDADNVGVGRVEYYPIENTSSELKRYQAGELDWTGSVPIPQLETVRTHVPDQLKTKPSLSNYYYGLNVTREPFRDSPELRQALSMAIDREVIVEKITRGNEIPAYQWVPPVVSDYQGARLAYADMPQEQRNARARELYAEAGYGEDNPLTVEIRYNTLEAHKKIASVIASMWQNVLGVDVELVNEEWKVFLQNVSERRVTEVFRAGWVGDYDDPYTFLELLHSDFGINGAGYSNPEYDALLNKASRMPGGEQRQSVLREAEAMLLADHPVIPVFFGTSKTLIKPYVKGYVGNPMSHYYSKDFRIEPADDSPAQ